MRSSHARRLELATLLTFAAAAGQWTGLATAGDTDPLRTIAAVVALPLEQLDASRQARVSGTVTLVRQFAAQHAFLAIHDGDQGLFVDLRHYPQAAQAADRGVPDLGFRLGSRIEVDGTVESGAFAPKIMATAIRLLGQGPLPNPAPIDMAGLFEGVEVARRLMLRGTVQAITERASSESWIVRIWTGGQTVVAELPNRDFPGRPDGLIDAEIELVGIVGSYRNTRGELIAPNLTVASPADVTVLVPAPESPFAAERVPLDAIARFRPARRGGHRVCTEGVVVRASPDRLFMFDGGAGVRVDLAMSDVSPVWRSGDRVEVAGFVTVARGIAGLGSAVVRKKGSGAPPAPVPVEPADVLAADERLQRAGTMARPGNHDGSLVRCRARLEAVTIDGAPVLALASLGQTFSASLPAGARSRRFVRTLEPGSELELTGIVEAEFHGLGETAWPAENSAMKRFSLAMAGPEDVVVLHTPPWWTPRRLAIVAAALAGSLVAGGIWLAMLRREVRRQTTLAIAEAAARRQDTLEFEVSLRERNRLAADLHDTILQTVAGIGFQLHASAEPDGGHLAAAKRMVEDAVRQLRGTVWSLRTLPTDGIAFSEALRNALARLGEGHPARITVAVDDVADQLPAIVSGNLLQVVKESVHNALRHAEPGLIEVHVGIDTAADTVTASVSDDGIGFPVGRQPGPAKGHFGLTGMRERAAAIGGTLVIQSSCDAGTTVVVTAPVAHACTSISRLLGP